MGDQKERHVVEGAQESATTMYLGNTDPSPSYLRAALLEVSQRLASQSTKSPLSLANRKVIIRKTIFDRKLKTNYYYYHLMIVHQIPGLRSPVVSDGRHRHEDHRWENIDDVVSGEKVTEDERTMTR